MPTRWRSTHPNMAAMSANDRFFCTGRAVNDTCVSVTRDARLAPSQRARVLQPTAQQTLGLILECALLPSHSRHGLRHDNEQRAITTAWMRTTFLARFGDGITASIGTTSSAAVAIPRVHSCAAVLQCHRPSAAARALLCHSFFERTSSRQNASSRIIYTRIMQTKSTRPAICTQMAFPQ